MKKIAFTFIELLLAIALTGIVGTIAVRTVKPMDRNLKYAISNVYHNLDLALYNGAVDGCSGFSDLRQPNCGGTSRPEANNSIHADALCYGLREYLTTTQDNCSSRHSISESSFKGVTPNLTLSNGTYIYIISNNGNPFVHKLTKDNIERRFYLIYADINGKKAPNSMMYLKDSMHKPDTFAFAAVDGERVIPIGPLEIDKNLLSARLSFNASEATGATSSNTKLEDKADKAVDTEGKDAFIYRNDSLKYVDALALAWGYNESYNDAYNPRYTLVENPHSYNVLVRDYIKTKASNPNPYILNDASGAALNFASFRTCPIGNVWDNSEKRCVKDEDDVANDYGCKPDAVDSCNISIDKFLF